MLRLSLFRNGPQKKQLTMKKTPVKKSGLMKIISNYQSPKENFEKTFDLKNEMMATCISEKSDHVDSDDEKLETAQFGPNCRVLKVNQNIEHETSTRQSSSPNSQADIECSSDDDTSAAEVSNFVQNQIEFSDSKIRMTELITPKSNNQKTPIIKIRLSDLKAPSPKPQESPAQTVRNYIFEDDCQIPIPQMNSTDTFEEEEETCLKNENIIVISQNDFFTIPTISEDLVSNLSWENNEEDKNELHDELEDPIAELEIKEDIMEQRSKIK